MALPVSLVWETRTTGNDNNGGAFVAGGIGTDYSQQNAPQVAFDGAVITATTAGVSATIAITGYTTAATDVDNVVQITGGTNFTAGFYRIVSQAAGSWTLDRNCATGVGAAMTGNMGGALATFGKAAASMVAHNKGYFKGGAYSETATTTFAQNAGVPSNTSTPTYLIGYATARGDGYGSAYSALPIVTYANGLNAPGIAATGSGFFIANIGIVHGTNTNNAWNMTGSFIIFYHCQINTFKGYGVNWATSQGLMSRIEITGGGAGATAGLLTQAAVPVDYCWIHDNACPGAQLSAGTMISKSFITNNSGATSDGILTTNGSYVSDCTIYKSGRDGIRSGTNNWTGDSYRNNILSENGGFGINAHTAAGVPALPNYDGNAFYNNTSGARNNMDDTTVNPIDGVSPYTNVMDITLTADPFTNKATNDYTLNNVAGGGAAVRTHGIPNTWPGMAITGYLDMGPVQHQDAGGGGGGGTGPVFARLTL